MRLIALRGVGVPVVVHPWRRGTVTLDWEPCTCPAARTARSGDIKVRCNARGCETRPRSNEHRLERVVSGSAVGYAVAAAICLALASALQHQAATGEQGYRTGAAHSSPGGPGYMPMSRAEAESVLVMPARRPVRPMAPASRSRAPPRA